MTGFMTKYIAMKNNKIICTDYDGMGNQGRFPKTKNIKTKRNILSIIRGFISFTKNRK